MREVTPLPSWRWYDLGEVEQPEPPPPPEPPVVVPAPRNARRPWVSVRWRIFHFVEREDDEGVPIQTRPVWSVRRRRP